MRLQILDPDARFACGSCTFCCDQPWHTYIEKDKAVALDNADFGAYPQLAGKRFYHKSSQADDGFHILAKGEGTRCLFLDTDGLCIIHKELGPEAKPAMCRQFPYLPSATQVDDRISVNFGCPAVQNQKGPPLSAQHAEVAAIIPRRDKPPNPKARVRLDTNTLISLTESDALFKRAIALFGDDGDGSIWDRFARLLSTLVAASRFKQEHPGGALDAIVRDGGDLPGMPRLRPITRYAQPSRAPSPARLLFAATIFRDTVPRDKVQKGLGFLSRLTLLPKLMSLAKLSGTYASLLLDRNVTIPQVLAHRLGEDLDAPATQMLLRYYRSRFWQRLLAGTRLTIVAGVHQHIQDLNAILYFARAAAHAEGADRLTEALVKKGLTCVEFHFANQSRAFDQKLIGWFQAQLENPAVALQSLRLMALKSPQPDTATETGAGATTHAPV